MGVRGIWLRWFGAGLSLSGALVAGLGYFSWLSLPGGAAGPSVLVTAALVVLVTLAGLVVVAHTQALRRASALAREDGRMAELWENWLKEAVTAARRRAWACAAVSGGLAVHGWMGVRQAFAEGVPDFGEAVFGPGSTVMAIGFVLLGAAMPDLRAGPWAGRVAGVASGVGVAGVVALATFLAVTILPVEAITTARKDRQAPVPGSVDRIKWRWKTPDGEAVRDVALAGGGAVVRIRDGVMALDTETGDERWHYRRPGAETLSLVASPDGSTVMAVYAGGRRVVLDAHTGRVRSDQVWRDSEQDPARKWRRKQTALSSDGYVARSLAFSAGVGDRTSEQEVRGYDLETSQTRWTYSAPDGCLMLKESYGALRDVFPVVLYCAEGIEEKAGDPHWDREVTTVTIVVLGLNPQNGSHVWRHKRTVTTALSYVGAYASADGGVLAVTLNEGRGETTEGVVLAQDDGRVIADRLEGFDDGVASVWPRHYFNGLSAGGYLIPQEYPRDANATAEGFRWVSFTGDTKQASVSWPRSDFRPRGALPLSRALVTASHSYSDDDKQKLMTVLVTPWDTGKTVRIPVTLEFFKSSDTLPFDVVPVLPAPGSVMLVSSGTPLIIGLV
ncbi:PQQ-binding-like beta-propeller repeat protein [Nonomuraea sp. B12E4]|uniref:outer membrane protein assembly factor BamB family protein n=1 Tax=Nonomuraea sp. B12E4 TaxID=3153564 RepID=UPI00325D775C